MSTGVAGVMVGDGVREVRGVKERAVDAVSVLRGSRALYLPARGVCLPITFSSIYFQTCHGHTAPPERSSV